ncbi:hypothetical protein [Umezawaea sp. Da 62-37]|uniref:hypothetical protein n=1 Tax=Umezawaea sp. Da 62-37 TaxID=3075927 RepID=UPI0028F70303|nr:hypothetical protein [Umezawaea sp. Da 62-37]WNV83577.1 hypothetical protein RM788_36150 [Umezawaea sp. Da 62-37]
MSASIDFPKPSGTGIPVPVPLPPPPVAAVELLDRAREGIAEAARTHRAAALVDRITHEART